MFIALFIESLFVFDVLLNEAVSGIACTCRLLTTDSSVPATVT
jgi:hypothetical protein